MSNILSAAAIFDKNARSYQERFMDTSMYHEGFDLFCDQISKPDAQILDIACGPGNITRYLLDKRPGFRILGIDLAPAMLALAQQNNPEASFRKMDARDITAAGQCFDGIICGFCLPYLSREEAIQLIQHAYSILEPGGAFYLSTMEGDYSKSGLQTGSSGDQVYMYYHEEGYLHQAITDTGMRVLAVRRVSYKYQESDVTDLIIIAVK